MEGGRPYAARLLQLRADYTQLGCSYINVGQGGSRRSPHLKAGMLGLAIMMASRWKRPSATKTIAAASLDTTGAVQPSTSPALGPAPSADLLQLVLTRAALMQLQSPQQAGYLEGVRCAPLVRALSSAVQHRTGMRMLHPPLRPKDHA